MNKFIYNRITDILEENSIHIKEFIEYAKQQLSVKYYVEITHCEDASDFVIQSKWFDTKEQAKEWFKNDIDFLGENYDSYLMYAEWNAESDSYGDIEQLEQLFKRND